ncbi:MAG TPA: VCBS repeat-containing protein, partial [Terriglobales bacterium]
MCRFVAPLLLLATIPGFAQVTYDATNYPVADITSTQVADFNRDGRPDIAFSASDGIHLKRNTGGGVFGGDLVSPGADGNLLAADVNGDGWPDLIDMEPSGSFTALLNHRDGTFTRGPRATLASEGRGMVAGDLNLDGKVDLIENQGQKLRVFKGTGVGSFTSGVTLSTANLIRDFELTDINGDGKLDLLVAEGNKLVIWPGLGDGTFGS